MGFNCAVIVREVWDTRDLIASPLDEAGQLKPGALATRFEPEDLNALEMALRVKDQHGGKVTAFSLGQPGATDVLKECLYRGVDEVRRVAADAKALDTQAAAELLGGAVKKAGPFDLVLIGTTTLLEGENSLLGAHLAQALGLEQVTYVDQLEEIAPGRAVAKRAVEMGYEFIEAQLPALLAVGVALLEDDPRTPRSAKAMLKLKHKKTDAPAWTPAEVGVGDPAARVVTRMAGYAAVPQRVIETRAVDPEDEAALKNMLDCVLKGA